MNWTCTPRWPLAWLLGLMSIQTVLLIGINLHTAPSADEPAHLAAGLYHFNTGRFDAYRVNPPGVRLACAAPVAAFGPKILQTVPLLETTTRLEWHLDDALLNAWGYETMCHWLTMARLVNIVPSLLGSVLIWQTTRQCFGDVAGLAAMTMWCTCPNQLAWSATIGPDVPAAVFAFGAYQSYLGVQQQSNGRAHRQRAICALMTGAAMLMKSTYLALPLLFAFSLLHAIINRRGLLHNGVRRSLLWLTQITACALVIVALGYGGRHVGVSLKSLQLESSWLRSMRQHIAEVPLCGQHLQMVPLPLPRDYLLGIDRQLFEFQRGGRSYLDGTWQHRGWWHYYLHGLCYKIPLGFLALFTIGLWRLFRSRGWVAWHDHVCPLLFWVIVVSSQTGFGQHFRYAFGCLPYVYTIAGAAFWNGPSPTFSRRMGAGGRMANVLPLFLLASGTAHSLSQWPRSHAYFNEACGGTDFGAYYLLDSNFDWGQDLAYVSDWIESHPHAQPLYHAVVTEDLARTMPLPWMPATDCGQPGWYIVSRQRVLDPLDPCYCLAKQQPIAKITSSLWVYCGVFTIE